MNDQPMKRQVSPLVTVALAAGLLLGVGFTILNAVYSSGPVMTPYQPDSLIYYQYGKAFGEGHAYRYTEDQEPSTGSTSHLYPAVLGLLYAIGARGEWLGLASFLLGVVSLTLSLVCVAWIVRRLDEQSGWLAMALCVMSGHLLFAVLGESDISLLVPLVLGAFASALYGRTGWLAICLGLAALCRPEGMVLSGLLFGGSLVWYLLRRQDQWIRTYLLAGGIGLVSAMMVLVLNQVLTGSLSFQSVNLKGYFNIFPFFGAVQHTAEDLVKIFRGVVWGMSDGVRSLYVMPVVGGALAVGGILSRRWEWTRTRFCEAWMLVGILASVALVASSGFEGLMFDRYFGWWMPIFLIYLAVGIRVVGEHTHRQVMWGLALLLIGFQALTLAYFTSAFVGRNLLLASQAEFARNVHTQLPPGRSIGMLGRAGLAYYLPGRSVVNLFGIQSPQFVSNKASVECIETLKHHPEHRFDYWLLDKSKTDIDWVSAIVGDTLMVDTMARHPVEALGVYTPRWDALEHGQGPMMSNAVAAVAGMQQVDSLDVGYGEDETAHDRSVFMRMPATKVTPFAVALPGDEGTVLEVGELVIGSETFTLSTQPGRPVRLVMRTLLSAEVQTASTEGGMQSNTYELGNPLRMIIQVDGQQSDIMEFSLDPATNQWKEIVIDVPAELITGTSSRITLGGDHISCAFWAYQ